MIESDQLPALPALRCLGDLADVRPVIVTDSREQTPLPFRRLATTQGTLPTGDYSFLGGEDLFAVERKTVADLTCCCTGDNRARFFRELHRLRGFPFRRLLVIGTQADIQAHRYVSQVTPQAVFATLGVIQARFGVPVVFAPSSDDAAHLVETWAYWQAREIVEQANTLARANGLTHKPSSNSTLKQKSKPSSP